MGVQEQKNKDNILPKLMAGGAGEPGDALFKEELKKYDDLVKEVSLCFSMLSGIYKCSQAARAALVVRLGIRAGGW